MIANKPDEDNTTPAAYNLYQTRLHEVTLFRDDLRRLKEMMIRSSGEDVATMLRDPAKGFAHLDPFVLSARQNLVDKIVLK